MGLLKSFVFIVSVFSFVCLAGLPLYFWLGTTGTAIMMPIGVFTGIACAIHCIDKGWVG